MTKVDVMKMGNLLRGEVRLGFETVNLKQAFIAEKCMELLLQSASSSMQSVYEDVFTVARQYMYLKESTPAEERLKTLLGLSKITSFSKHSHSGRVD